MNDILRYIVLSVIVLSFSGCFEKSIKCNNEVAQELILKLSEEEVINHILFDEMMKKNLEKKTKSNDNNLFANMLYSYNNQFVQMGLNLAKNKEGSELNELYKKLKEEYVGALLNMSDFRTTNQNKELKKVECSSTASYVIDGYKFTANVNYTTQLTDDGQSIYVELHSLTEK